MSDADGLLDRFKTLCTRMELHGDLEGAFADVSAMYQSPPRAYHNLDHVEYCLRQLDPARTVADRPDEVEMAIWLHDCVYDPKRSDNESRSAEVAENLLRGLDAAESVIARISQLILDTAHATEPETADGELIVDIDLSILGAEPGVFDAYESAIRMEYAHVSDAIFAAARRGLLDQFLARPAIYRTRWFASRNEAQARANLARSITCLRRASANVPPAQRRPES